jgi:hypothetical protein
MSDKKQVNVKPVDADAGPDLEALRAKAVRAAMEEEGLTPATPQERAAARVMTRRQKTEYEVKGGAPFSFGGHACTREDH